MSFWIVFFTGLTVGGLSCLAVQGGLLASVIAAQSETETTRKFNFKKHSYPIFSFLLAKISVYTILGFLLGLLGEAVSLSDNIKLIMQALSGLYMIVIAANLLNLHPIFRYAVIQPPKFLTILIRKQSKSKELFAPGILGAMTIFIPCGTTLAMEALAISTGKPLTGALIMALFTIGTTPLFFIIGFLTSALSRNLGSVFFKTAAILVFVLGVITINGSLVASGSKFTLQNLASASPIVIDLSGGENISDGANLPVVENGVQTFDITVTSDGYAPNYIKVNKNQPVRLNLKSQGAYSCALSFRIPSLGIAKNLQPNDSESVEFTPTEAGKITFSCSMGMYPGTIEVI